MSCKHRRRHPGPPSPPPASGLHGNGVPRPQMNELQRRREERARSSLRRPGGETAPGKGLQTRSGEEGGALVFKRTPRPIHSLLILLCLGNAGATQSIQGPRSFGSDVLASQGSPLPSSTLSLRHLSSAPQTEENRTSCGLAPPRGG